MKQLRISDSAISLIILALLTFSTVVAITLRPLTPKETVEEFLTAVAQNDEKTIYSLYSDFQVKVDYAEWYLSSKPKILSQTVFSLYEYQGEHADCLTQLHSAAHSDVVSCKKVSAVIYRSYTRTQEEQQANPKIMQSAASNIEHLTFYLTKQSVWSAWKIHDLGR